mgnify:CR=1 FL=1
MSTKVHPFESPRVRRKSSARDLIDLETENDLTKSPRPSPRVRGNLSRQNSLTPDESRSISRQNSFKSATSRRRITGLDDDAITDHSGANSARGKNSKNTSRKSSKSSKKKVIFKIPLIDPRPERAPAYMTDASMTLGGGDNSLNEEDYKRLEDEYSHTPRRMKKRRSSSQGRWRRYIPFGQYIPTLPSFMCSVF